MNWRGALLALALLPLAACSDQQLYGKLSESQANEMVAVLSNGGIEASKKQVADEGWAIGTSQADFARAVEVLHAQGYPRDEFASLGTVFKKEGFVSSPLEERARLTFGLSQELSNTISQIDGVVQARVQLAMPEADPLSDKTRPSSASVFIKYRPGVSLDGQIGPIKALVVNSVEGLTYDNVTVAMFAAQPLPTMAPPSPASKMLAGLQNLIIPALVLGALFIAWPFLRRWQMRRKLAARSDEPVESPRAAMRPIDAADRPKPEPAE